MALVQVLSTSNISDGYNFFSGSHWDGVAYGTTVILDGYNFPSLYWDTAPYTQSISESLFQGYIENWGGFINPNLDDFENLPYVGYTSNWGQTNNTQLATNAPTNVIDINSVVDHPKDQFIYYKLKGYNTQTSSYESWIIKENITGRPELFDPDRNVPSVVRDVYKTPPSLNNLVNITIVARWIQ